jgi:ubiquinone/menaquinone biosynthesis C-methylase UbiE
MTCDLNPRRRFLIEYGHIRHAEGRGSDDPTYYQALPYHDVSGRNAAMWAMRAKTYRYFESNILAPIEKAVSRPLDILDLGAGNAWMSYRLSLRKHSCVALDIFRDEQDGLLAARNYPQRLPLVEAEFDQLPFGQSAFDLVVYNSSLHYSTDYCATLAEARRCLRRSGQVIILDSPVYRRREHGEMMIAERHTAFYKQYGFRSDAMPSIEFLDREMLKFLAHSLGLRWTVHRPWYGWKWHLRPLKARLKAQRPPSQFWILAGKFGDS